MNTAIAITIISVMGTAVFGLFFTQFQNLRDVMQKGFDSLETKVDSLETKVDENTAAVSALDTKFTGAINNLETRMTEKFLNHLREHGERFARIEAKLDIDPPAEAA